MLRALRLRAGNILRVGEHKRGRVRALSSGQILCWWLRGGLCMRDGWVVVPGGISDGSIFTLPAWVLRHVCCGAVLFERDLRRRVHRGARDVLRSRKLERRRCRLPRGIHVQWRCSGAGTVRVCWRQRVARRSWFL